MTVNGYIKVVNLKQEKIEGRELEAGKRNGDIHLATGVAR